MHVRSKPNNSVSFKVTDNSRDWNKWHVSDTESASVISSIIPILNKTHIICELLSLKTDTSKIKINNIWLRFLLVSELRSCSGWLFHVIVTYELCIWNFFIVNGYPLTCSVVNHSLFTIIASNVYWSKVVIATSHFKCDHVCWAFNLRMG